MFEVRLHGRGGQGVVTAAELLSVAAFRDGHEAQAFPSFGSERMAAPVVSFCRVADAPIRLREPITDPDAVFAGLVADGFVLINSSRSVDDLGLADLTSGCKPGRIVTVPATELARRHTGRPLPNVCILGAFAALTGAVTLASIETAVRARFRGPVAESNVEAARAAYAAVVEVQHA